MSSATDLCGVGDQGSAGAVEVVVEHYGCGECGEPGAQTDAEVVQCACAVSFEGEDVFAGPEDRFDPLADRGEVRTVAFLVFAAGPQDRRVEFGQFGLEVAAAEVLIADQDVSPARAGARSGRASAGTRASRRPWAK